ncbi:cyclin-like protein interacting with PHO85 [Sporothrix eucalyptigena]|uniref:Cyclin-like protein interacting with PHO85 n=1 Tax=Sporothrix eucalyptigena TaxID=1812306 RepID=A0ABP0BW95_9PEZI
MATLIGDVYGADSSPFHNRAQTTSGIATAQHHQHQQSPKQQQHHQSQHRQQQTALHHQHQHPPSPQQSQERHMTKTPLTTTSSTPHHPASPPLSSSNSFSSPPRQATASAVTGSVASSSTTARIPTPPDSSSPNSPQPAQTSRDGFADTMTSSSETTIMATSVDSTTSSPAPPPSSSSYLPGFPPSYVLPVPPLPQEVPEQRPQRTIMIRDLNHIQSLMQSDSALGGAGGSLCNGLSGSLGSGVSSSGSGPALDVKFEISAMPIGDIIEMVAALLTKITTTNDHQHDALHRNASQQRQAQAHNEGSEHSSGGSPFSASVLAFHGKNVPAITILSYLSRIHKYCPTTYEVFLSLLVYFDRMTERVNELVMRQQQERERRAQASTSVPATATSTATSASTETNDVDMTDEADETDEGLADSDSSDSNSDDDDEEMNGGGGGRVRRSDVAGTNVSDALSAATYFVVDSYNIHRLIIAGVTCASKFFSDVFYTNARYAKVGGLPLAELNHLELQFLILNDFRLAIPIEDLEAYATMLVEFYAREVVGTRPRPSPPATGQPASNAPGTAAAPP